MPRAAGANVPNTGDVWLLVEEVSGAGLVQQSGTGEPEFGSVVVVGASRVCG